ncbi:MAG: hypothetical protein HYV35_06220 [Lentisphaerae bacterium]|nr:hypothetical protein [Lentisphaerota bacterium]
MKLNKGLILPASALLVFLAGIVASVNALRQNAITRARISAKLETLAQLAALKQTHDRHQRSRQTFEHLTNAAPADLASLAGATVSNATPEIREREARNLVAGWTLRQAEVVFNEVDLSKVSGFLQAAENQRPPWKLVECTLLSSRKADGLGRAVLILEALEKTGRRRTEDGR